MDAAIVATPTTHHFAISRELLEHGIHLLVEKPLTVHLSEADELIGLAADKRLTLQVGHIERFNPALVAAAPYMERPCYVESFRASGYACRSTDIGVVLDLMIHDLDIVLAMVHSPVADIQAVGATILGPHEDMAQARITFANGSVANFTASRTSFVMQRTMRAFTRDSFVTVDFAQKTAKLVRPAATIRAGIDVDRLNSEERDHLRTRLFEDYLPLVSLEVQDQNALVDEQRDFITSVRTGRAPRVPGTDARRALALAAQICEQILQFQHQLQRPDVPALARPHFLDAPPRHRQAG
jgi:predicted dehydrogenase